MAWREFGKAAFFLIARVTWRNIIRACGLGGMIWQMYSHSHPDPTVLLALAAMMGLPTFLGLDSLVKSQGGDKTDGKDDT
jgi:hypothetical protein